MSHIEDFQGFLKPMLFLALLLAFTISTADLFANINLSTLPFWDDIDQSLQEELLQLSDPELIAQTILKNGSQLNSFFLAMVINILRDEGVENLLPRLILAINDRERTLEILQSSIKLLLLENRNDEARELSETVSAFFSKTSNQILSAEINIVSGNIDAARREINEYLQANKQQDSKEYVRSLYLIARLFLAEENESAAINVLRTYFEKDQLSIPNSLYYGEAAKVLRDLLTQEHTKTTDDNTALLSKLDSIVSRSHLNGIPYPDISILIPSNITNFQTSSIDSLPSRVEPSEDSSLASPNTSQVAISLANSVLKPPSSNIQSEYLIQVGAFSKESNAINLEHNLSHMGYSSFTYNIEGKYKVFIDPSSEFYRNTVYFANPDNFILDLRGKGIEGFRVKDPR